MSGKPLSEIYNQSIDAFISKFKEYTKKDFSFCDNVMIKESADLFEVILAKEHTADDLKELSEVFLERSKQRYDWVKKNKVFTFEKELYQNFPDFINYVKKVGCSAPFGFITDIKFPDPKDQKDKSKSFTSEQRKFWTQVYNLHQMHLVLNETAQGYHE